MKPEGTPEWPHDRLLTPRTASVDRIRELGIVDFELPVPGSLLAEILPFGLVQDSDGTDWVAVRVTIDLPATPASVSAVGWIDRSGLEQLPHLRELILQAPEDPSTIEHVDNWKNLFTPSRRSPSLNTRQEIQPADGRELLAAWRRGRRPVLRTIAFMERLITETEIPRAAAGIVAQAWQYLTERELNSPHRAVIILALEAAVEAVEGWIRWPQSCQQPHPAPPESSDESRFDDLDWPFEDPDDFD